MAPTGWAELRWDELPGPPDYHPAEVEPALAALAVVENEDQLWRAYNRFLFAVGNNHAGVLYPAAVPAMWRVSVLLRDARPMVRRAAANVLVELAGFEPADEWFAQVAAFGGLGGSAVVARALASNLAVIEEAFGAEPEDPSSPTATKSALREVLAQLEDLKGRGTK